MIANFIVSLNTVGPIFILLGIGIFLSKKGTIDDAFIKKANTIVYTYGLPCTMFKQIYSANFDNALNPTLMLYTVVVLSIITVALSLIVPLIIKDKRRCGAFVQNSFRSNFILLGTVMAINLFGEDGAVSTVLLVPAGVMILTICSIIVFTIFSPENDNKKIDFMGILKSIVTNPVIIAIAIGILIKVIGLGLPKLAVDSIASLSAIATPLALLSLGAQLKPEGFKNMTPILMCCLVKLIIVPIIAMIPAILFFDFNGYEIGALFFVFCAPAGVSNYSLAYSMKSDYEFTGQVIVLSSILSFITMIGGIFFFIQAGIFNI